jgi:hypothetical protein
MVSNRMPMWSRIHLPRQLDEVTPTWLTHVLRARGTIQQARVMSVQIEPIGTFSSELWRLHMVYDRVEPDAPPTLILKQPKPDASERPSSGFANEVRFYRDVAHQVSVRTPRFHFGYADEVRREAMLLLEDVGGLVPIDWEAGVTAHHAHLALEALASLHAAWWDKVDGLNSLPHLADAAYRAMIAKAYDRGWHTSRDFFKSIYGEPFLAIGDALVGRVEATLAQMGTPATLLHGDAHFENLVIVKQGDNDQVLFIDWADARRGLASFDVAVFAVQSFPTPGRRRKEAALVATHASGVRAAGLREWSDPWLDYRRGVLNWVIHMIQNAALRPGDAPSIVIERYVAAAVDLHVRDLVS